MLPSTILTGSKVKSLIPSTFLKVTVTLSPPIARSLWRTLCPVSNLVKPILSDVVAPILAFTVSFEYAPIWNSLFEKFPLNNFCPLNEVVLSIKILNTYMQGFLAGFSPATPCTIFTRFFIKKVKIGYFL
ncbi:hypothetical protein [Campylobacter canadensis]|uniref:hypothetical protein n=1 Tax=Campylobacter canadensis TaxID=449520 RepID=UPI0031451D12